MGSVPEHNPKQASHTMPTTEEVKQWNVDKLIKWLQGQEVKVLPDDKVENFKKANFAGRAFLAKAGEAEFFEEKLGLSIGDSIALADLAWEIKQRETARNRQQAEDVEMSEAADMKSKLLSFTPCTPRRQQANNLTGPRRVKDAFKAGIPYKLPRSLLNTSGLDWVFQPHPELYKIIAPNVLCHYTKYKENQIDKTYAPIYFYLGGAGTGKSRHGSEFASSVQQAIRLHTEHHLYHELSQRLKTAFVFHVSFENGTSLKRTEKSEPLNAVGVRMLYQLLGGNIENIRSEYVATPRDVFELVAAAENVDLYNDFTGILVVDGIQRAMTWNSERMDKESCFYGFLDEIGDLSIMSRDSSETEKGKLRRTPFIITCVTGTYLGPACQFLVESHRKRVYLPLNRLDAPTWKDDNSEVLNDDLGTHLLLNDVGGHARAIEAIADTLKGYRNGFQPNITELANRVLFTLQDRYKEAIAIMGDELLPVVQCILSRQPIRLQAFIPGSDLRWEHITAPGLLWFEKIEEAPDSGYDRLGYLVAPYMWLWLLARLLPPDNLERLYQFLREWEFNDYQQLLYLQTGQGSAGKVTWQNFETFCCYFRILRSLGLGDGQEVRFKRLYSGCKKLRDDQNTIVVNRQLDYAEAVHQYSTEAASAKDVVTKHTGTLDTENQLFHVILNAPNAPAGDFFLSIETRAQRSPSFGRSQGKIVREVGQCKFIDRKLDEETYIKERDKSAGSEDFFILYTTAKTPDDIALPDRSGLVDESCWMSYFGPLAGRAFIASRHAGSQVEEP